MLKKILFLTLLAVFFTQATTTSKVFTAPLDTTNFAAYLVQHLHEWDIQECSVARQELHLLREQLKARTTVDGLFLTRLIRNILLLTTTASFATVAFGDYTNNETAQAFLPEALRSAMVLTLFMPFKWLLDYEHNQKIECTFKEEHLIINRLDSLINLLDERISELKKL